MEWLCVSFNRFWPPIEFWGQNDPQNSFWGQNDPKTRFGVKITPKTRFEAKMTPKRRFGVKMTPKPPFWGQNDPQTPILGGKPPWGVPPKKRQKRTVFNRSQSSYRAKSQRSSPTKLKSSKCNFSSRILKEKMRFFRRLSLGKVAHGNFEGKKAPRNPRYFFKNWHFWTPLQILEKTRYFFSAKLHP